MFFEKFANNRNPASLAAHLRQKRFEIFSGMLADVPGNIQILDVGGTQQFWEMMIDIPIMESVQVVLLNREEVEKTLPNFESIIGDGRDMSQFEENQFDLVFSNSTIEHVGDFSDQKRMADEVMRVGKKYFVQTPNRYFPIEPHFVFPFFQFFPLFIRGWLVKNFNLGWVSKTQNYPEAINVVKSIRLITRKEMRILFPDAALYKEKLFGLTKSFVAYSKD